MMALKHSFAQAVIAACACVCFIATDLFSQPDTLWTRAIRNGSLPLEVIQTHDGGFAIGGGAWDGDQERPDRNFSLIKTDSVGIIGWRMFYQHVPDSLERHDDANAIEQLSDGGYVLVGRGPGGDGPSGQIVRTDSDGEMIWARWYEGGRYFYDCALGAEDNIITVDGYGSSFALKIDLEDGDIIWQRSYAIEGSGTLWNVTNTSDSGFLLTGNISSIGEGLTDMYAVKVDSDGEVDWYNAYGTEHGESVTDAIQTADGGYCLTGYLNIGGAISCGIVIRTDPGGEEIWRRIFIDNEDNVIFKNATAIVETPDGGFGVLRNGYDFSAVFGRINSEGELLWISEQRIGGSISNDAYSLLLLEDFGYLLGGSAGRIGDWLVRTEPDSLSVSAWDLQATEAHDFGNVNIDSTLTWDMTLTNEAEYPVYIHSIMTDSLAFSVEFEDILALEAGEETSISISFTPNEFREYTGTLTVHTKFRDLVVELTGTGVPLSVSEESDIPFEFALYPAYPNPFNNEIRISFSLPEAATISLSIIDLTGREVDLLVDEMKFAGNHGFSWTAKGVPTGIYFCRVEAGEKIATQKLTLIR